MNEETQVVEVDLILAAIVRDCAGYLEVTSESLEADYGDSALALGVNEETGNLVVRLVEKDSVVYEDE